MLSTFTTLNTHLLQHREALDVGRLPGLNTVWLRSKCALDYQCVLVYQCALV